MNSFIPIFSAFFILLGLLVWRFPKLIAGYNTMTPEQQKKSRRQSAQILHVPRVLRNRHTGFRELPAPAAFHG